LPTFQKELYQIEQSDYDITWEYGIPDATVEFIERSGWKYDENLTRQFTSDMNGYSPVDRIDVSWAVFVKTDDSDQPGDKNIRVYSIPDVVVDYYWVLTYEGKLNSDGEIELFSYEDIIEELSL
jgi:hypothetical protein